MKARPARPRRKRLRDASARARASALQLAAAHEAHGIVTWIWDPASSTVHWYGDLSPLLGLAPRRFRKTFTDYQRYLHPDDVERARAAMRACLKGTQPTYGLEERVIWPDGTVHWLETYGRGRYRRGRAVELYGVVREITSRKEQELALQQAMLRARESSDKYRAVFDTSPEGICITRQGEGTVFEINEAALRVLGRTREEVLGRDTVRRVTWDNPQERKAVVARVLREGRVSGVQTLFRHPDGTLIPMLISATQVELDGEPCILWTWRDITELRRAEAALQELNATLERRVRERTAELEAANRDMEGFLYSISHDLRAPVRAVSTFAELLRSRHGSLLPEDGQRLLSRVEGNARRMSQLIADLLEFSRTGRGALHAAPVDMGALATEVADELRPLAPPAARIVVGPLPPAHGDASMLRQVWSNLIGNALKFSRHASRPRVEVSGRSIEGGLEYSVADNGAGFDMEHASKLFGVFQRLHSEKDFEGTGVGLAVVQRIVEKHGGRVSGEGAPQRGATFRFTLPS